MITGERIKRRRINETAGTELDLLRCANNKARPIILLLLR